MTPRIGDDWKQLAVKFGPGWALAALLVYFLLASVSKAQGDIKDALAVHGQEMKLDSQRTILILRVMCVNQAPTTGQQAACMEASR